MALNLTKSEPLNLTKSIPLKKLTIGAGWDVANNGPAIDLDLLAHTNNKGEVCFFNQLSILNGAIAHTGDNRTGEGDGADEEINVDFENIPDNVTKITFALSSYSGQNFDQIEDEFIQIANTETGEVLAKSHEDVTGQGKTLILAEVNKVNGEWVVNVINEVIADSFQEYASKI